MKFCLLIGAILAAGAAWLCGDDAVPPAAPVPAPGALAAPSRPHNPAPTELAADGLAGKSVAITIRSDPEYGIYLENVQVAQLGGRDFLVGTGIDSGIGEWYVSRRVWVAVDDISEMIEFGSPEELRKALEPVETGPDA